MPEADWPTRTIQPPRQQCSSLLPNHHREPTTLTIALIRCYLQPLLQAPFPVDSQHFKYIFPSRNVISSGARQSHNSASVTFMAPSRKTHLFFLLSAKHTTRTTPQQKHHTQTQSKKNKKKKNSQHHPTQHTPPSPAPVLPSRHHV